MAYCLVKHRDNFTFYIILGLNEFINSERYSHRAVVSIPEEVIGFLFIYFIIIYILYYIYLILFIYYFYFIHAVIILSFYSDEH
jgi:hypothetical protein